MDTTTKAKEIKTSLRGYEVLKNRHLNKAGAFSKTERQELGLMGLLPDTYETLDQQMRRVYTQYLLLQNSLAKNHFLNLLHQTNSVLFFALVKKHFIEMLPIIYTPTVGDVVQNFSHEFYNPEGIYLSHNTKKDINKRLRDVKKTRDVELIVITDGEGVLGIGDQGIGGIEICRAKLMIYTLCAGIDPNKVLPIQIDVGTDNQTLLEDPMYRGWRNPRIRGKEYDNFIGQIVQSIQKNFPKAYLHWEDFGRANACRILTKYRKQICSFNDDMQGTGAVALATINSACFATNTPITNQTFMFFGAGTAGCGVAQQIFQALVSSGLTSKQAHEKIWLIDRNGVIHANMPDLTGPQQKFARLHKECKKFPDPSSPKYLATIINTIKPSVLIGCSAVPGAFTKEVIQNMSKHTDRPLIMPLSNPITRVEAHPHDILEWSNGQALIATGSPFPPVQYNNREYSIAQCNNAIIYPGIGLGVLISKAKYLTDNMIMEACKALGNLAPAVSQEHGALLPNFSAINEVSSAIAIAVAKQAVKDGVASPIKKSWEHAIAQRYWHPEYARIRAGLNLKNSLRILRKRG